MENLQGKAVIIENASQLKRFKVLMKNNDIEMHYPPINTEDTFYAMIYQTDMGFYIIPNSTLKGTDTSVMSCNFEPVTLNQIKAMLPEDKKENSKRCTM